MPKELGVVRDVGAGPGEYQSRGGGDGSRDESERDAVVQSVNETVVIVIAPKRGKPRRVVEQVAEHDVPVLGLYFSDAEGDRRRRIRIGARDYDAVEASK